MLENCDQPEDQLSDYFACLQDPRPVRSICVGGFASIFGTLYQSELIWLCKHMYMLLQRRSVAPLQGCILYDNWWPMLTMFFYVLIPMPYLFFGAGAGGGFYSSGMEVGYVPVPSHTCAPFAVPHAINA